MSTATLATKVEAGEQVTGRVVSTGREIRVILATDRTLRDGMSLSMDGVRFRRGVKELPLIVGHDLRSLPIGKVRDIRVESRDGYRCLTGALHFGGSAKAKEVEADIRGGILTDVSIGFDIDKHTRDFRTGRVTSWLCTEASLVPVGLDEMAVVYQRSHRSEEVDMSYPSSRTRGHTRPYGAADRETEHRDDPRWTPYHRALLRSMLSGGRIYQRALVDGYERAVQQRWQERGRTPVTPWYPAVDNEYGTSAPLPRAYTGSDDHSRIFFIPTGPSGERW